MTGMLGDKRIIEEGGGKKYIKSRKEITIRGIKNGANPLAKLFMFIDMCIHLLFLRSMTSQLPYSPFRPFILRFLQNDLRYGSSE